MLNMWLFMISLLIPIFLQAQVLDDKIAVLQLSHRSDVNENEVIYLTAQIQEQVQTMIKGRYQVITQENILTLLPENQKLEDCIDRCEVDIGRMLGAALIITGQLIQFGTQKELRCMLKLHDSKTATLLSSQTIKGKNIDEIEAQLNQGISQLLKDGLGQEIGIDQEIKKAGHLEQQVQAMETHYREVKNDWEQIKIMWIDRDENKMPMVISAITLFLKKYQDHPLGNAFEGESQQLLAELKRTQIKKGLQQRLGLEMEIILIKGGSFVMGQEQKVKIKDFYMGQSEVTVAQYRKCIEAGVCTKPYWHECGVWDGIKLKVGQIDEMFMGDDQPVICIDWHQARTFSQWVGGDLPSEAQWEYAARAQGKKIMYPWGDQHINCQYAVMNTGENGCGLGRTWAVCRKTKGHSEQGLCDMMGNVWEWVLDEFHESDVGRPRDGGAWCGDRGCLNQQVARVFRGGGWYDDHAVMNVSHRLKMSGRRRVDCLGFRVVLDIK